MDVDENGGPNALTPKSTDFYFQQPSPPEQPADRTDECNKIFAYHQLNEDNTNHMGIEDIPDGAPLPQIYPDGRNKVKAKNYDGLKREKGRLNDCKEFPLTNSGSKMLSVGINPLAENEPTVKIVNSNGTSYIRFNIEEFAELIEKLPTIIDEIKAIHQTRDGSNEELVMILTSYNVFLKPNNMAQFRPLCYGDTMYLAKDTLKRLLFISSHIHDILDTLNTAKNHDSYAAFDDIVQHIIEMLNECSHLSFDDVITDVIHQMSDPTLYELYSKFYVTIKHRVTETVNCTVD